MHKLLYYSFLIFSFPLFADAIGNQASGHGRGRGALGSMNGMGGNPGMNNMGSINQMGGGFGGLGSFGGFGGGAGQGMAGGGGGGGGGGNKEGREESKKSGEKAREELNKSTEARMKEFQQMTDSFGKNIKDMLPKDNNNDLLKQFTEGSEGSDSSKPSSEGGDNTTAKIVKEVETQAEIHAEKLKLKAESFAAQPAGTSTPQTGLTQSVGEKLAGADSVQRGDPLASALNNAAKPPIHSGDGGGTKESTRAFSSDFATGSKVYNPPKAKPTDPIQ